MIPPHSSWRIARIAIPLGIVLALGYWLLAVDPSGQPPGSPPPATTVFFDRHGSMLYEALDSEQGTASYAPLQDLPAHLLHATIATEDATFYSNPGVDPLAILRAVGQNLRSDDVVSGGSTLTQQLARNLWMTPSERADRSLWRKARESAMALRLSARLGKDKVLEWYLNTAPYGHQTVGVDAAARVYLGKRGRDLDLAEAALLAGLPQSPSLYDPFLDLPRAQARQRIVLSLMARQGYITEEEAAQAGAEPIRLASAPFPIRAPHFVALVQEVVAGDLGLDPEQAGGLRVYTTLDLGAQEVAESTVRRHIAGLSDQNVTNGALVAVEPGTGAILAMVGSADYFDRSIDGQVNVAVSARQPGSSIKPVLYAAALEQGFTPGTILYDVPTAFVTGDGKSYAPENYDRAWHGPVSVRDALANSYNLPAVATLQRVGIPSFLNMAARMGLTTLASRGAADLSLALGSGEVRPLDLAMAYASLAAGGEARRPLAVTRVEDASGRLLWQAEPTKKWRVTSEQVAYLLTSILSDNEARSPSFGDISPLRLSRPAAAKTGTTTDWRDNWTAGYTPDLVAVVWVGNANNSPMRGVSGITGAAPIWHDFMEEVLKGRPPAAFQEPAGLERREVCPESGQLPSMWCPNRRVELFAPGTAPTQTCSWHQPFGFDRSTGLPAGPDTPAELVEQRVFEVVPPELEAWAREQGMPQPPAVLSVRDGRATQSGAERLRIALTSPARDAVFQISPDLPARLQKVNVAASASGLDGRSRIEIRVDGVLLASLEAPPFQVSWQLAAGRHRFRVAVLDAAGAVLASDEAEIAVEQSAPGP